MLQSNALVPGAGTERDYGGAHFTMTPSFRNCPFGIMTIFSISRSVCSLSMLILCLTSSSVWAEIEFVPSSFSSELGGTDQNLPLTAPLNASETTPMSNHMTSSLVSAADGDDSDSRFGFPPVFPDLGADPIPVSHDFKQEVGPGGQNKSARPHIVPKSAKGVQELALIVTENGFLPKTLFATRDTPVRLFITGASKRSLCILLDSFKVRRQVSTQRVEEIEFLPTIAGAHRFYCPINGIEGTLFVRDSDISSQNQK